MPANKPPSNVTQLPAPRQRRPPPPPPPGASQWYGLLRRDDRGRVIPDLANVLIALREETELLTAMGFNEMKQHSVAMEEWPHARRALSGKPPPHAIEKDDISRLQEWLQEKGLARIGKEIVSDAIEVYARERPFHPIRDRLNLIEWDGEQRLSTWTHECLGAPDDEYHRAIGRMFLISMVARILRPGCKCDYIISLEGPQGEEKSKFCRALAGGDEYFSDSLPPIDGDQVRLSMHLKGKWLVEIAELAAILRADPEGIKHFISRQAEDYTPKFGHNPVHEPRQCVFIGTTNDDEYIRDATGGRRYWPLVATGVRVDRLEAMRDQLFAEAVHALHMGEQWWPDREFEKAVIAPIQDDRQWEDAWTPQVGQHIETQTQITIAQLAQLMGIETARLDRMVQRRLADILRKPYGWRKFRSTNGVKVWRSPEMSDPSAGR